MKALVVSQNGGFVKMHEAVIPVIQELGMDYTVVYSHAEARAAQGWEWSLVEWLLPLNPRPSTAVSVPGITGTSVSSSFATCLPLLKAWSASRPDARMLAVEGGDGDGAAGRDCRDAG